MLRQIGRSNAQNRTPSVCSRRLRGIEMGAKRMTFSLLVGSLLDFEASEGASPLVVVLEACKDVSSAS